MDRTISLHLPVNCESQLFYCRHSQTLYIMKCVERFLYLVVVVVLKLLFQFPKVKTNSNNEKEMKEIGWIFLRCWLRDRWFSFPACRLKSRQSVVGKLEVLTFSVTDLSDQKCYSNNNIIIINFFKNVTLFLSKPASSRFLSFSLLPFNIFFLFFLKTLIYSSYILTLSKLLK